MWSGERLAKIHATTVPEKCRPEVWSKMGKTAQKKEKQEWANEKPKLDDARRLRGIYFIDPEDGVYKETIQNARTKLEVRMEAAMRCRRGTKMHSGLQELKRRVMKTTRFQKQSMRALWKFTNQESVWNHLYNKVMKAMKIPDAKAAVEKEWKKLETIPALQLDKAKSEREVILEAEKKKRKVHFATLMDICHLRIAK